jgi:hypothetical protein
LPSLAIEEKLMIDPPPAPHHPCGDLSGDKRYGEVGVDQQRDGSPAGIVSAGACRTSA